MPLNCGLDLAPFGIQVAGRSKGQFPNATLHDPFKDRYLIIMRRMSLSSFPKKS